MASFENFENFYAAENQFEATYEAQITDNGSSEYAPEIETATVTDFVIVPDAKHSGQTQTGGRNAARAGTRKQRILFDARLY